ncbi:MAG: hypothetical protein GF344_09600 [Chitinivibrionales bacterium]|nr:hypothetical protein [Chitinivibrionales bacterium]MBD3357096.1 hypothetical protein [Chitinivibrionales bacterium]
MGNDARSTNIVFIGFTAGGKSSVGKAVARLLSLEFRDLDGEAEKVHLAETGECITCREIYSRYGRERLFELEGKALERLRWSRYLVLSTGGGAPINERNRGLIAALGRVVYLCTSPVVIFKRLGARGFPRYLGDSPQLSDVESAYRSRESLYREIADVIVDNSELTIEEAAEEVCRLLGYVTKQ